MLMRSRLSWILWGLLPCLLPAQPAQVEGGAPVAGIPLRQILLETSAEAAEKLTLVPGAGFVVVPPHLSFLDAAEIRPLLAAAEGRPIEERLLVAIAHVIQSYLRKKDFPIGTAVIPQQRVTDGALRVVVFLGKFREIRVQGNRWFSETLIREKLRVEKGEVIRLSALDRAANWTNSSAFRRVRLHVDPIPNTDEANLIVGVEERLPLRLNASFDNGGNEVIGNQRFIAGATYGNVWGEDHVLSYQFVTTNLTRKYKGHAINYHVPLPWRHQLQFSASYSRARPEFFDGLFVQDGKTLTADLRYSATLLRGRTPIEAFAGLGFKESNNNLEFGGTSVQNTMTNTFQAMAGASMVLRDRRGGWLFALSTSASPGNLNSRNTDEQFAETRFGARSRYLTANFSLQRALILPFGWEFSSRANLQWSSTNLLTNEQFTIGGANSVRGYQENTFIGDEGFMLGNELASPLRRFPVYFTRNKAPVEARVVGFFDAAKVSYKHELPTDRRLVAIASVGIGVRASLPGRFVLSADHGRQLSQLPFLQDHRYRTHLKIAMSY